MNGERLTAPVPLRPSAPQRIGIYAVGFGLWASGGLWLLFHFFVQPHFGAPHPLEPWWMKLHGACAFASLWLFGLLWGVHVVRGWSGGRRRWSGATLAGILICLMLSGYLLYYVGDEDLRDVASIAHWSLGLASPLLFFAHYWARRSSRDAEAPDAADAGVKPRVVALSRRQAAD